jgi:hypothetical protein
LLRVARNEKGAKSFNPLRLVFYHFIFAKN